MQLNLYWIKNRIVDYIVKSFKLDSTLYSGKSKMIRLYIRFKENNKLFILVP